MLQSGLGIPVLLAPEVVKDPATGDETLLLAAAPGPLPAFWASVALLGPGTRAGPGGVGVDGDGWREWVFMGGRPLSQGCLGLPIGLRFLIASAGGLSWSGCEAWVEWRQLGGTGEELGASWFITGSGLKSRQSLVLHLPPAIRGS